MIGTCSRIRCLRANQASRQAAPARISKPGILILEIFKKNQANILFNTDQIFEAMKKDKKRVGEGLALIMMLDDYSMKKTQDLRYDELAAGIKELGATLRIPTC